MITGFEPLDVLDGIRRCVAQLEAGKGEVENAYAKGSQTRGNQTAQEMLATVFEVVRPTRGEASG